MLYKSFFISQDSRYPASIVGSGIPAVPVGDNERNKTCQGTTVIAAKVVL